jgi:putative ABC transport system permease protein
MSLLLLFYRLIVRPIFREPVRTALTVLAIALGVAVVLAIDLAGNAAAGSFHSSMETLAGDNSLEITATGGVPESVVGTLASLPYDLRVSPRVEGYAFLESAKQTIPLIGLDLISEGDKIAAGQSGESPNVFTNASPNASPTQTTEETFKYLNDPTSIWVGASLHRKVGDHLPLLINDHVGDYVIRGVYPDSDSSESAIVMDIGAAQQALSRVGRLDRILVKIPQASSTNGPSLDEWQRRLSSALPPGTELRPEGTGTAENRQMLSAFRWNLRLLSYISLVVGAFLIYNTISVSVVRRRPEIGIVRALGASRALILSAFLGEAACFGFAGALFGIPLGRWMAAGAVKLIAATVESLYVSSRPGPVELSIASVAMAAAIGVGVAVASALSSAREAASVSPVDAMARARREYVVRVHKTRDLSLAALFGIIAVAASRAPAVASKPYFGYAACIALIIAMTLAIPAFVILVTRLFSRWLGRQLGVEALLASRSLYGSLRRTSVLIAALSTAIAMMVSVGIMVGSFRETVAAWMEAELPADLYIRPAGDPASDRHPTLSPDLAGRIASLPNVAGIDRLRAYEIQFDGLPVTLVGVDLSMRAAQRRSNFLSGRATAEVVAELRDPRNIVVSEPFTSKHHVATGDTITLSLGEARTTFHIVDVFYDYSTEHGEILMDRGTMQRYLPDPAPSNLAVYVAPGATIEEVRREILDATSGYQVLIASNRELRGEAIRIFDRTFAITYALEGVAAIVAVVGIAGAFLGLVIDRRREFGLLRFLGATSAQIRKLILVEAGVLGLLANVVGATLGYFLSLILIFIVDKQSFGWTIRFHWPVELLLGALSLVYVSTILAGLYPAAIAVRLDPLGVMHDE